MSILSDLNTILDTVGVPLETGYFSGIPPDEYLVLTPIADVFEGFADNLPQLDLQEVMISLYSKNNYIARKDQLVKLLLGAGFSITDRRYLGFEEDTKYHHINIDVAKEYAFEED